MTTTTQPERTTSATASASRSLEADRRQLMEQGYLIVRGMIRPEELPRMRDAAESMVERTRAESRAKRTPEQPPGGWWDAANQPRVTFGPGWDDPRAAPVIEFCLGERTMDFSRRLMDAPAVAPVYFAIACSAQTQDYGPANWHRDIHPHDMAPLDGLQLDTRNNNPAYLQWNIPLYDDPVLWVVPGSHFRRNTPEENRVAVERPGTALPGGVPVDLKAGDGVVYINMILHWGSNYSRKLRRTIHLGFRSFGGRQPLNHLGMYPPRNGDGRHLAPQYRAMIPRFEELWARERDLIEATLRALVSKDADAFRARLTELHPGEVGREVTVVILSKVVNEMLRLARAGKAAPFSSFPRSPDALGEGHSEDLASRFSAPELETLRRRFADLERRLRGDEDDMEPMFQSSAPTPGDPILKYRRYPMPERFDVEAFVASWDGGAA